MNRIDRFIVDCPSFEEFRMRTSALPLPKDKGDVFERLTQVYLQTTPEYRTVLETVWLRRDVPARVRAEIGLPPDDLGIDLIAHHRSGRTEAARAHRRAGRCSARSRRPAAATQPDPARSRARRS